MMTRPCTRHSGEKEQLFAAGLLLVFAAGCQHDPAMAGTDAEAFASDLALAAIEIAGDFIRALAAAFLF